MRHIAIPSDMNAYLWRIVLPLWLLAVTLTFIGVLCSYISKGGPTCSVF